MESNNPLEEVEVQISNWFSPKELVKLSTADLTPQMVAFAHAVCSGLSPNRAAAQVGYGGKNSGNYLIKNPKIQEEIRTRQAMMVMATEVSKEGILAELLKIYHTLPGDIPGTNLKLKALEMISKVSNFYSPDTLVQVANQVQNINIEIVRPDEHKLESNPGIRKELGSSTDPKEMDC
jgi:hypothetical protein